MGAERRDTPRRNAGEPGEVTLNGLTRIKCTITDVSGKGARLSFRTPMVLPKRFELRFAASGHSSYVTVMWQRGLLAGVRLATPHPMVRPAAAKPGLRQRLLGVRA